ncbi:MAG: glycosyltransferase [Candidatus Nanoarchaeia archaeon]|nr:glycosyltransferase [Candidatus Nanoarchaeia archaeon]MDD5741046.1 glycosyltransferase [Candidatus Nanoarchaeia archaeon]
MLNQDKKLKEVLNFKNSKIGFLSNFPPKECGIATFTRDLITSLNKKINPKVKSRVIALNEESSLYNYDSRVIMQMNKDDLEDYINIAKRINRSDNIKIVCIQHEFGLFGGEYGNYIIPFLETIEKPVVVTFHSVLPCPDESRKKVVRFIGEKSAAIIVMAEKAVEILNEDYGIPKNKIYIVPHGIPDAPLQSPESFKKKLRLENKIVLSTFGLLSKGKGIEYAIKSLPTLVKKYPNIIYLVIGETHPAIRKNEGEKYRNNLINLVKKLGLQNNVKFYNKYLSLDEIIECLLATDIYICTNLDKNQIVSGTLSYAIGCGKAVVSTPSVYAQEVLNKERGLLVRFRNPKSFSEAIDKILSDNEFRNKLENNAYSFGRSMIWQNVALSYFHVFNKIVKLREETTEKYPHIKLNHLINLTDNVGCTQFAKLSIPDKSSGYTVDDNSRALIVAALHEKVYKSETSKELAKTYLKFLEKVQDKEGKFNDIEYNTQNLIPVSEDALGRTIWALGCFIDKSNNQELIDKAKVLFDKSCKLIEKINSPRAKAFSIIGLYHYYKKYNQDETISKIRILADSLVELYKKEATEDWDWFEGYLTYSNSKLPEVLFLVYDITKQKEYLEIAEKTLNFLSNLVFIKDELSPIGQNGWCNRNGTRAFFDQQPIDASSMVQTYLTAYLVTKNKKYYDKAVLAFNWFLGKNHLKQMIYNETTGGCYDGLSRNSINLNQGAESTIEYLISRLMLEEIKKEKPKE